MTTAADAADAASPAADAADAAALAVCAQEPIHRLGSIQPHGAVLVLDPAARRVRWASATWPQVLGAPADAPALPGIGLLPAWLRRALAALPEDAPAPLRLHPPDGTAAAQEIFAHRGPDGLVLEFVLPTAARPGPDAEALVRDLAADLAPQAAPNPFRDAQMLARAAAELTGHERVLVYRFRPDWSGEVIAEARRPHLAPFLGLRFPAADIPAQARALYLRNRLRVTVDAAEAQAPMLPADAAPDLSMAILRSVSPVHREYLGNMGVRASLVASVIVDGRLWGLVACHHGEPSLPAAAMRDGLAALVGLFEAARGREEAAAAAATARRLAAAEARLSLLSARDGALLAQLMAGPDGLARLAAADGVAWIDAARVIAVGAAPPPAWLRAMAAGLAPGEVAESSALSRAGAPPCDPAPAAGWLAVRLAGGGVLAAFRREFAHEVAWGGDPGRVVEADAAGGIGPRKSFSAWRESVRGTATAWGTAERAILCAAAAQLDVALVADPAMPARTWALFAGLGPDGGPAGNAGLRVADLLPGERAIAVTAGSDSAAETLFVSAALEQLLGGEGRHLVGRPWHEAAASLGIAHAFAEDGHVPERSIEAWSPGRGLVGLSVAREPLLQLDGAGADGVALARTLSAITVADRTLSQRQASALAAAETRSDLGARAQGAVLRNLNHELRTPVHGIMGLGQLIAEAGNDASDEIRGYGEEVVHAGRHLLEVIDAMLDLARIEAGTLVAGTAATDLAACLREAASMAAPLFAAREIAFARRLPARRVELLADARMLRQAVLNLLTNAAKFTPVGGSVSCALALAGAEAVITVADSGPGIPPDQQARIFEPFAQGVGEAGRHHGGMGLGLFLARTFVGLHGGRIELESAPGRGATFRIVLPGAARA